MIIKNGEVFQEDGSFRLQDLYVENHRIVASEDEVTDKTIVDAAGLRVLPGLVDIHSHGAFGHDFSDADPEGLKIILKYEKSHGITSYCPTSMTLPAEELKEMYEGAEICVIDSLCASVGEGLLYHKARCMKEKGKTLQEVAAWVEKNKLHICHNVAVDDLNHLYRGGRLSRTSAVVGSMINIKPFIHMDENGKLVPIGKVRGRKKSLNILVDAMAEQIKGYEEENDVIMISHGDCIEDARYVGKLVEERFGIHNILINYVGTVIGSHTGTGVVALCFMGNKR